MRRLGRYALVIVAGIGIALVVSSPVERLWLRLTGGARLMSVAELPDTGESCYRPEAGGVQRPNHDLFADSGEPGVEAQEGTIDVGRPPVRILRDTAPIYSS